MEAKVAETAALERMVPDTMQVEETASAKASMAVLAAAMMVAVAERVAAEAAPMEAVHQAAAMVELGGGAGAATADVLEAVDAWPVAARQVTGSRHRHRSQLLQRSSCDGNCRLLPS